MALICSQENIHAVQRHPTPPERVVVDEYDAAYKRALGHRPHGLHYIPIPGAVETVPVWFPPAE
jgi:hypothetical protein